MQKMMRPHLIVLEGSFFTNDFFSQIEFSFFFVIYLSLGKRFWKIKTAAL